MSLQSVKLQNSRINPWPLNLSEQCLAGAENITHCMLYVGDIYKHFLLKLTVSNYRGNYQLKK